MHSQSAPLQSPRPAELKPGEFIGERLGDRRTSSVILSTWTASTSGRLERHQHRDPHLVLVLSGAYAFGASAMLGHDFLVFNPPMTEHEDQLVSGGAWFTITFRPDAGWAVGDRSLPVEPVALNKPEATTRARRLLREMANWGPDSILMADSFAMELMALFRRSSGADDSAAWLHRARELLDDCYMSNVGLNELAAAVEVHPFHLIRAFRKQFGSTPGEYLRQRRVREAADLLTRTDMAIAEVALVSGFSDQPHLTHRFNQAYGIPPGAFRRRTRGAHA